LSGFDPKFASISPGTLLIGHAIEQAMADGSQAFDFLRGVERYKYLWGAHDTATYRRSVILLRAPGGAVETAPPGSQAASLRSRNQ